MLGRFRRLDGHREKDGNKNTEAHEDHD
jgi:hypothetical protein